MHSREQVLRDIMITTVLLLMILWQTLRKCGRKEADKSCRLQCQSTLGQC